MEECQLLFQWNCRNLCKWPAGSIGEFIDGWFKERKYEDDIFINDERVTFTDDGIKVGCKSIDKETVLKIAEKLK